jgi:phosphotransacetylase
MVGVTFQTVFMTSPAQPPAKPGIQDLASRIYVELVGRAFLRTDNAAVIKPDAAELAKLSIQLAEIFRKHEAAANAAAGPQNVGYKVDIADMAKWEK